jgi:hypothetical protein
MDRDRFRQNGSAEIDHGRSANDQAGDRPPRTRRPWRLTYQHVVLREIEAINARRSPERQAAAPAPGEALDAVGLALSGGGIRSASICLGVLQALNDRDLMKRVDYLSTVSGGGYIGCSLSAAMSRTGQFPFGAMPQTPQAGQPDKPPAADISDTAAVGHIRNYSNYLIPNGFRDVTTAAAIVVRGLVANLSLLLPVVLTLAALTVWSNPTRRSLGQSDFFGIDLGVYLTESFGITLVIGLALLALFFLWALARSLSAAARGRASLDLIGAWCLGLFALAAFVEFQPFVIEGMFEIADGSAGTSGLVLGLFTGWLKALAAAAAPVAVAVTFLQRQLAGILKSATAASSYATQAAAFAVKIAIWIAALALPLIIWIGYLYLSYWAILNDGPAASRLPPCPPAVVAAKVQIQQQGQTFDSVLQSPPQQRAGACAPVPAPPPPQGAERAHAPNWLLWLGAKLGSWAAVAERHQILVLYLIAAVLLYLLSWLLAPNANSLHQLYRDRLGKAFLFDPSQRRGEKPQANVASRDQGRDFVELDRMRLSALTDVAAPYLLIGAALNIQGSDFANRRGRNADFFLLSKYWIGSQATGYAPTEKLEATEPELDLATAMAISGAAASANMGANTIRPLTPTLALLNIRLGYWLANPNPLVEAGNGRRFGRLRGTTLYLWQELTGRLYENSTSVYLTDGGHIENLGIYELLRRQCRVIIAVDAEADPAMNFNSLVTLQRYARIDLGVRISLPWQPIRSATRAWMACNAGRPPAPPPEESRGPHVAIGLVDYGGGATGYLVYIKSSLSGDENDYIRDYARRYAKFPHETTGDQFFSEEQFEVYRALGFHMAHGWLAGNDDVVAAVDGGGGVTTKFTGNEGAVGAVREALGMRQHSAVS